MSAYIVDHDHIDALMSYAIQHNVRYVVSDTQTCVEITKENATEIGRILLDENERSVRTRYPDCDVNDLPGTIGQDAAKYKFRRWRTSLDAMVILKACSCFDYQASETADYDLSLAAVIIRAIRQWAINRLPGYDGAQELEFVAAGEGMIEHGRDEEEEEIRERLDELEALQRALEEADEALNAVRPPAEPKRRIQ